MKTETHKFHDEIRLEHQTGDVLAKESEFEIILHLRDCGTPACAEVISKSGNLHAEIGLWFNGKLLEDYDGVFELPPQLSAILREKGFVVPLGRDELDDHECDREESWWEHDARGIPLCRVCPQCKDAKLSRYRRDVLENPEYQSEEPIDAD